MIKTETDENAGRANIVAPPPRQRQKVDKDLYELKDLLGLIVQKDAVQ